MPLLVHFDGSTASKKLGMSFNRPRASELPLDVFSASTIYERRIHCNWPLH